MFAYSTILTACIASSTGLGLGLHSPIQGETFLLALGNAAAAPMGLLGSAPLKSVVNIQAAWDYYGLPGCGDRIQHKCHVLLLPLLHTFLSLECLLFTSFPLSPCPPNPSAG